MELVEVTVSLFQPTGSALGVSSNGHRVGCRGLGCIDPLGGMNEMNGAAS